MNIVSDTIGKSICSNPGIYAIITSKQIRDFSFILRDKFISRAVFTDPFNYFTNDKSTVIFVSDLYYKFFLEKNLSKITTIFLIDTINADVVNISKYAPVVYFTTNGLYSQKLPEKAKEEEEEEEEKDYEFSYMIEQIKETEIFPTINSSPSYKYFRILRKNKYGNMHYGDKLTPEKDKFLSKFFKTDNWERLTKGCFERKLDDWRDPTKTYVDYEFQEDIVKNKRQKMYYEYAQDIVQLSEEELQFKMQ